MDWVVTSLLFSLLAVVGYLFWREQKHKELMGQKRDSLVLFKESKDLDEYKNVICNLELEQRMRLLYSLFGNQRAKVVCRVFADGVLIDGIFCDYDSLDSKPGKQKKDYVQ